MKKNLDTYKNFSLNEAKKSDLIDEIMNSVYAEDDPKNDDKISAHLKTLKKIDLENMLVDWKDEHENDENDEDDYQNYDDENYDDHDGEDGYDDDDPNYGGDNPYYNPYGSTVQNTKQHFNEGDDIIYVKAGSERDGKKGKFIKEREDGKYSLVFDDGKKFAGDPKWIFKFNRMKPSTTTEPPKIETPKSPLKIPQKQQPPKKGKILEGKKENQKIDELLDKGFANLTSEEKELLKYLNKGGELKEEPKRPLPPVKKPIIGDVKNPFYKEGDNGIGGVYIDGPDPFRKIKFKGGDKITYVKGGSPNNGKSGIFLKVREDGKYSIVFDDGIKFAANPMNVYPYKKMNTGNKELDPYDEETWENEDDENINNVPGDFYFHVRNMEGDVVVILTSIQYFNEHDCVDDNLGSHNISGVVRNALNHAGVYGDGELTEAMWEGNPGFTVDQITENMIAAGFVHNPDFVNFINNHL